MPEPNLSHSAPISTAALRMVQQEVAEEIAMQVETAESISTYSDDAVFSPLQRLNTFKELQELRSQMQKKGAAKESEETEEIETLAPEAIEETATRFQKGNQDELQAKTLQILRSQIKATDTPEEALKKVLKIYPDPFLADEALDFLIETADPNTLDIVKNAKQLLNEQFGREIKAGRNMSLHAREFSQTGLGSPTALRDLYRDVTGNARDPLVLFNELTEKFQYEKLKSAIHFMLHSLGSDLRSKGPSIPRGELKRLVDEIRSLQGILGVFRFFSSQMRLIERQFGSYGLVLPQRITFELLAKIFIKILSERFVNPEKLSQLARLIGMEEQAAAQMILYTHMRDALKQVAPKYYRNPTHRDQLWQAFMDTIEQLEEKLDEEEEEGEKQDKEDKKKRDEKP